MIYHALIRTHHITSRKKVAALKTAAKAFNVSCLLCSGGSPGIMYVEGDEHGVKDWVSTVQRLKYKDYQLASRPTALRENLEASKLEHSFSVSPGHLIECDTVKDFGSEMEQRGVSAWWRKGMGFAG